MSAKLIGELAEWLTTPLAADLTPAERCVLFVIAERSKEDTRLMLWHYADHLTLIERISLASGAAIETGALKKVFARLAKRGLEVRIPLRTGSDGRPVFAREGVRMEFRLPVFPTAVTIPARTPDGTPAPPTPDPGRHPTRQEQELGLAALEREQRRLAAQQSAQEEREAWEAAQSATETAAEAAVGEQLLPSPAPRGELVPPSWPPTPVDNPPLTVPARDAEGRFSSPLTPTEGRTSSPEGGMSSPEGRTGSPEGGTDSPPMSLLGPSVVPPRSLLNPDEHPSSYSRSSLAELEGARPVDNPDNNQDQILVAERILRALPDHGAFVLARAAALHPDASNEALLLRAAELAARRIA